MITLPKPRYTEACNHCGLCCSLEICPAGENAYPDAVAPCPGMLKHKDGFLCSLVIEEAAREENALSRALGIGVGCSMPDESTTDDEVWKFDIFARIKMGFL